MNGDGEAQGKVQQLRVDVDADLHVRLKVLAAKERRSLRSVVVEALEEYLWTKEGRR